MNDLKFFSRRVKSSLVRRMKLDEKRFSANQLKLEEAKTKNQKLIDVMPGIEMPMVIHPDMYFYIGYTKYIFEPDSLYFIRDWVKPGQTILDVGANIGYFSLFFAKLVAPRGRVIAFEPGDFAFNLLKENKELNQSSNLEIYQAGLGERDEIAEFYSGAPGMEVYNSLGNIVHPAADINKFDKIDVRLFKGSTWFENNRVDRIDLMKLDVEGGEYTVLKGMLEMFRAQKISRLLIEMTYEMSRVFNYDPSDIIVMLKECGYDWFELRPFGRLEPLVGKHIKNSGMFVAVSQNCTKE